jgi:catechol 2,3-dioxygenase-like lactoylglutathione lyase family enzyme
MPSISRRDVVVAAAGSLFGLWLAWWRRPKAPNAVLPPTLFRRTTLLVSDIGRSLVLYKDALGLEVVYDQVVPIGGKGLPTGIFDATARLVFLKSYHDHTVGVLGLLQYLDKPLIPRVEPRRQLGLGDAVLVLNTVNVEERMERICKLTGVYVQSCGTLSTYPGPGGGTVTVKGNSFFDWDGNFIECNEIVMA